MTCRLHALRAAIATGAVVLLAACSASVTSSTGRSTSTPSPGAQANSNPSASQAPAPGPTTTGSFDAVHAAQVLSPSVALIIVNGRSGTAEGSGFVVQSEEKTSFLATNNHVVEGSTKVQVLMPDGRHYTADVQGTDPLEDVAVLKVPDGLPVAQFADSSRAQVGQPVVAIGSPLGGQGFGSVTVGVISAMHRTLSNVGGAPGSGRANSENLADVLQTDAPINPGNSGGPLADGNGRVVGMNTAGSASANSIGYAIPSRIVQRITQNLIAGRAPGHPYLGICFQPIQDALARDPNIKGYGVVISRALPGSPAERSGLQPGDVIEKIDGVDLNNGQTLGGVLQLHNPGDTVKLDTLRGSGTTQLTATLGDRPASGGAACPTTP